MKWHVYFSVIVILVLMMSYSIANYDRYYPVSDNFLDNPEKYMGARVENCGLMINRTDGGFIMRAGINRIFVKYNATALRYPILGTVCLAGSYREGNFIEADAVRINDFVFVKYFISFLAILYAIFIFSREWELTKKGFKPRLK